MPFPSLSIYSFPQDTSKSGFGDGQKWGWTPLLFLFVVLGLLNLQVVFIEDVNMSTKVLKSFSAVEKLDVTSESFFIKHSILDLEKS